MAEYRCATCKGHIEVTRKTYLTLDESRFEEAGLSDALDIYCVGDCFHLDDLDAPESPEETADLVEMLVREGHAEAGAPKVRRT